MDNNYSGLGIKELNNGNYKKAFDFFSEAINENSNDWASYWGRGNCSREIGDLVQALSDFEMVLKLKADIKEVYLNIGGVYANMSEYSKAIDNYNSAIRIDPNYHDAYYGRGLVYNNLNEFDKAVLDLTKAIQLNPNNSSFWSDRGISYSGLKKVDNAIQDFKRASEIDPNWYQPYYNLGNMYMDLENYREAIKQFEVAIEKNKTVSDAYANRGISNYYFLNMDKALQDMEKAIDLNPKHEIQFRDTIKSIRTSYLNEFIYDISAKEFFESGIVDYNNHNYESAIKFFTKAIESYSDSDIFFYYRCRSFFHSEKYKEGLEDLFRLIQVSCYNRIEKIVFETEFKNSFTKGLLVTAINTNNSENIERLLGACIYNFFLEKGKKYVDEHNYLESLKNFNRAIYFYPNLSGAYFERGLLMNRVKNYSNALLDFNKALEISPNNKLAHANKAAAHYNLKDYKEAILCWENAIHEDAELYAKLNPIITKAKELLKNDLK